jgi:hypothetical protein
LLYFRLAPVWCLLSFKDFLLASLFFILSGAALVGCAQCSTSDERQLGEGAAQVSRA